LLPDNRMTPFNPALLENGIAVAALLYVIFTPALLLVLGFIFSLFGGWPPAFEGSAGGVLFFIRIDLRQAVCGKRDNDVGRRFS